MAARFCLISQVTGTCATVTGTFKDSSSYGLCGSVECLKKSCRPIADIPVAHPLIEGVSVSACAQAGHLHGQAAPPSGGVFSSGDKSPAEPSPAGRLRHDEAFNPSPPPGPLQIRDRMHSQA